MTTINEFKKMVAEQHARVDEFAEHARNADGVLYEERVIAFQTFSKIFGIGMENPGTLYIERAKKRVLTAATDSTLDK
ncbi:hypothetical protein [Weissella tructae]